MKYFKNFKKNQLALLLVMFVLAIGAGVGVSHAMSSKKSGIQANQDNNCEGICIDLLGDKASPDTIAVKNGSYIQFNTKDGLTHDLSMGDGGEGEHHHHEGSLSSGDFGTGEAWRVKLTKDGAYSFHDHLHPKINVVIVVYTPGKDYTIK